MANIVKIVPKTITPAVVKIAGIVGPTGPAGSVGATGPQGPALNPTSQSFNPVWAGTGLTYTGTPATGTYIQIGKLVHFMIQVHCSTVTNFGTGTYTLTLPTAPLNDYAFRDGGLHSAGNHYALMADADESSTVMNLYYTSSSGKDERMDKNSPKVLATTDYFYVSGTYLIP